MNDRLAEFYRGVAVHATADSEHTAALELLALVMAADHSLAQSEIDTIKQISDDWRDGDFTFDKYVGPAIVKAQDAITKDEVLELIDDIDQRISSRVLRRALFSAAREVAGVDADVSPEEGSILA
ncbi:MAG TPA: TerB family tellurite resistance protein, partial [Ilumatobacter sp.]|nr:TerB family tellurite resistance protein [Ilumatobacter sp.]